MDKSLSQYSKENGISYQKAWRLAKQNQIQGVYTSENGRIMVKKELTQTDVKLGPNQNELSYTPIHIPLVEQEQASTAIRLNISALINPIAKYINIHNGILPYQYNAFGKNDGGNSGVSIRESIVLAQKAYHNISIVQSVINIMSEFSVSDIFLKGGSKKSRDFFYSWFDRIGLWALQEQFYRELYKTSNVFLWTFEGTIEKTDIKKLEKALDTHVASNTKIPVRYTVLNPADIDVNANLGFPNAFFVKILSDYELSRLRNPRTEQDQQVLESLPESVKEKVTNSKNTLVLLPLPADKVNAVFYKKSDYDDMAIPWVFPVLADLEFEMELRNMDQALARTCQQVILLVTMGSEEKKGGTNQKIIEATQELFKNQSVSRVLVADYTTKAAFIIPDISELLGPEKYEVVQRRIKEGLNSILTSTEEKFANQSTRVSIFLERLRYGRNLFKYNFLLPEMKKVAKAVGLKQIPEVIMNESDGRDHLEYSKLYIDLARIGLLTADETIKAINTGELPDPEESKESQEEFRKSKDKGYYEPITGGPFTQEKLGDIQAEVKMSTAIPKANGRPSGSKRPQSTKKVSPIGKKRAETLFDTKKAAEMLIAANKLINTTEEKLLKRFKIKELNSEQKNIAGQITELVITNEKPEDWDKKLDSYIKTPVDTNLENVAQVNQIVAEHNVSNLLASVLLHCKV